MAKENESVFRRIDTPEGEIIVEIVEMRASKRARIIWNDFDGKPVQNTGVIALDRLKPVRKPK